MKLITFTKHFKFPQFIFSIFIGLCFEFLFSSCSKPINNRKYQKMKDFAFQQVLENQKNNKNKYYYSPELNVFFLRHQIDSNGIRYLIEVNNPEFSGILEGTGFYSDYVDNGLWIEKILKDAEIDSYGDFSISRPYDYVTSENGIEIVSTDTVTKRWISSNKRLNTMQYENEVFVPLKKDDNHILISSSGNLTTRAFYSEDFILQKKEYWNITKILDSFLIKTEEYFYNDKTKLISKKTVSASDSYIVTFYDDNKMAVRTDVYRIDGENKYIHSRTLWRYAANGKINIEEATEFYYKNNNYKEYSDKITRRQAYIYKENEEIPPDYKYYENGVLRMKTIYQNKENYITQIYFDGGYSVQSIYENNLRKKDIYLMDDVVRRVKVYD